MASPGTRPTLESIVTRFRREAERAQGAERVQSVSRPELEVRLQDVDYANFAAILGALLTKTDATGKRFDLGEGALTHMVSAIMDIRSTRGARSEGPQRHLTPMRIREIYFAGGNKVHEQYVYKEPLVAPLRVPNGAGLSYLVALSAERGDDGGHGFSADEGAVIRVKARVSFLLRIAGAAAEPKAGWQWRIDMTVTRQIMGSDAGSALPSIREQMFRTTPAMTPQNILSTLRLADDASPAARKLYRYEVEAELAGPEGELDQIRPADVTAAAETILRLANPEYVREAAGQAEVYRAARYIAQAPGYQRQFQHELGLKRLLPEVTAITRADYRDIYPPKDLFLTDKADGKRALAIVHDGRGVIVADTLLEFGAPPAQKPQGASAHGPRLQAAPGPRLQAAPDPRLQAAPDPRLQAAPNPRLQADTIVDGELVTRKGEGGETTVAFYAFDVIAVAGENVTQDGFEKRLAHLDEAVAILAEVGVPASAKSYARIVSDQPRDLEPLFRQVYEASRPYTVDGLILVEPGIPYADTRSYKWKSARDNTIDFLARRAPASVLGKEPFVDRPGHKVHFLFVGIRPDMYSALGLQWCPGYADLFGAPARRPRGGADRAADANTGSYFPIQFAPSDAPLAYVYQHPDASPLGEIDGKVVEGRCAGDCAAAGGGAQLVDWEMVRVREDRRRELLSKRYYGNDFYVAELIWLNYVDPFPVEQLWEGPSLDYFLRPKAGVYRAQTAVMSFMKHERILSLKHASWVVDIGAGKGQDLGRYLEAEVQHLVAIDQDRAALAELVRRKYSFAGRARQRSDEDDGAPPPRRRGAAAPATTIHVLVADVAAPHGETLHALERIGLPRATADAVVCNLAVHYFLGSVESMRNFVALARGAVKVGGQVVVTALMGEAVHALFRAEKVAEGGTWELREGATGASPKFALKRLYSSPTLEAAGQRIGVLLPFSDGRYYEENLVNMQALAAEFSARGFRRLASTNAADLIPTFENRNRSLAGLLTSGDRKYLSLYGEVVFRRDK